MMRLPSLLFLACAFVVAASSAGRAAIQSVVEVNRAADSAQAIIVNGGGPDP
jgi:hypothetical protein